MKKTNIAPWLIFVGMCIGAFTAPFLIPWAQAQRVGYVERASDGAFANQLAPNPVASKVLAVTGTGNRVAWVDSPSGLPSGGTPGQVPTVSAQTATQTSVVTATMTTTGTATAGTYSATATTTGTTTLTVVTMATPSGRNTLGDYYLANIESEGQITAAFKLDEFAYADLNGAIMSGTRSASCSSGSDGEFEEFGRISHLYAEPTDPYPLWLDGTWRAHLWASSTGPVSLRIEVWDNDGLGGSAMWFSFSTATFDSAVPNLILAETTQSARYPASTIHYLTFKIFSVCSTPQTATLILATPPDSRIESPVESAKTDVAEIQSDIATLQSDVTAKEPLITGVPGQFVKFIGTGTSVTTSKGSSFLTEPSALIQAQMFVPADGAVEYSASTWKGITLADGAIQGMLGAFFVVPNNPAITSVTVRPAWMARSADASSHTVRWLVSYQAPSPGDSISSGATLAFFTGLSGARMASRYYIETGTTISVTPGQLIKLGIGRVGDDAADTYVGDVSVMAVLIDYATP